MKLCFIIAFSFFLSHANIGYMFADENKMTNKETKLKQEEKLKSKQEVQSLSKQKAKLLEDMVKTQEVYDRLESECNQKCNDCDVAILCDDRSGVPKCSCICYGCSLVNSEINEDNSSDTESSEELKSLFSKFCTIQKDKCYSKYVTKSANVRFICDDRDGHWKSSCIAEGHGEKAAKDKQQIPKQ